MGAFAALENLLCAGLASGNHILCEWPPQEADLHHTHIGESLELEEKGLCPLQEAAGAVGWLGACRV